MPATHRLPLRADLDAAIDAAFQAGGMTAATNEAARRLGWTPTEAQVLIAVGRAAWRLNERRGDQTYQRRMERLGRPMPLAHPERTTAAQATTPTTLELALARGFGVELEFGRGSGHYGQQSAIVATLVADGLHAYMANGYGHEVPHGWKMTSDATVTGGELVSPILRSAEGHRQTRVALAAIRQHGGVASASQGLHVHHDVTDFDAAALTRLIRNLRWAEEALMGYVPRRRWATRGSGFAARRLTASEWDQYEALVRHGSLRPGRDRGARGRYHRYIAWNFNAVLVYGSLEWRLLGHTLNARKVATWVKVGQAMHAYSLAGGEFGQTVTAREMVDALADAGHLARHEADRYVAQVNTREAARRGRAA